MQEQWENGLLLPPGPPEVAPRSKRRRGIPLQIDRTLYFEDMIVLAIFVMANLFFLAEALFRI